MSVCDWGCASLEGHACDAESTDDYGIPIVEIMGPPGILFHACKESLDTATIESLKDLLLFTLD